MTYQLSADPGLNTGVVYGYYDAVTPYQLLERWQIHGGVDGFLDWWWADAPEQIDECVVEKFLSMHNKAAPDISGVPIEGVLAYGARLAGFPIIWQNRMDKGGLIGYPPNAVTDDQRQRARFDFLDRFGLFAPGTENDDSNDAVTHALVSLKRRKHMPTIKAYWGGPKESVATP